MPKIQVSEICKAFANGTSTNKILSKYQLDDIWQSEGFLGRLLAPLLKTGLPLMKNVLQPLAKNILIQLGLTAIDKKMFGLGTATLISAKEDLNDIMKIIKSLKEFGLLIKGVSKTIKNEVKQQKGRFIKMLLDTFGASLTRNMLQQAKV